MPRSGYQPDTQTKFQRRPGHASCPLLMLPFLIGKAAAIPRCALLDRRCSTAG